MAANIAKLETMPFQMVSIRLVILEEAFGRSSTGEGATYWERLMRETPRPGCIVEIIAGSITYHQWKIYRKELEI